MSTPAGSTRRDLSSALLWCSALAIAALIIVQAGRLTTGTPAYASMLDVVASGGDYTLLTARGSSEDALLLLDQRTETLLVYGVAGQNSLEFRASQSLRDLFFAARQSQGAAPLPELPMPAKPASSAPAPR